MSRRSTSTANPNRQLLKLAEAQRVMQKISFFREFEMVMPGLIEQLAKITKIEYASKDEVIFRQGDPSVDCYAIMRGAVRTYIRPTHFEKQRSPRVLSERNKAVGRKPLDHSISDLDRLGKPSRCSCIRRSCRRRKEEAPTESKRYLTTEGHNTYSKSSDLGQPRVDLHVGDLFGELGLMNDQPRSASIQCLEACKFLVIPKKEFVEMFASKLKTHAESKYHFFHDNVPGFHSWAMEHVLSTHEDSTGKVVFTRDRHPADSFEESTQVKGYKFLREGQLAEPTIVIVKKGEVAFWRKTVVLPRKVSDVLNDSRAFQTQEPHKKWDRANQIWQIVGAGEMFCSLQIFGLPCLEPFSAEVISGECSVYTASGSGLQRIPQKILNTIKAHTTNTMKPLLWRSPAFVSCFAMPGQLPEYDADVIL